jgi:hypothetical protein
VQRSAVCILAWNRWRSYHVSFISAYRFSNHAKRQTDRQTDTIIPVFVCFVHAVQRKHNNIPSPFPSTIKYSICFDFQQHEMEHGPLPSVSPSPSPPPRPPPHRSIQRACAHYHANTCGICRPWGQVPLAFCRSPQSSGLLSVFSCDTQFSKKLLYTYVQFADIAFIMYQPPDINFKRAISSGIYRVCAFKILLYVTSKKVFYNVFILLFQVGTGVGEHSISYCRRHIVALRCTSLGSWLNFTPN